MLEIVSAFGAVKSALEIAKTAKDTTDEFKISTAMSEIMDKLTSAQSALLEMQLEHQNLINENQELRKKLSQEAQFDKYSLKRTSSGGVVWQIKNDIAEYEGIIEHAICPKCRVESRLMPLDYYVTHYQCRYCNVLIPDQDGNQNQPSSSDWNPY